ncbi:AfsR/SARP family transcriptional regulator [Streptomyces sp. NPDC020996]|uniref:AfsR/SARP family transcriptional regulator n=1 Tax=Streptomyces sp. NPDC020996 TaxID=3154791 RepID=UPI00340A0DE1
MQRIQFRLLGPVGVWLGDQPLGPTTPQQRSVLAVLLIDANRVVSMDNMSRALWGENPPNSARNAIQGYVSRLRRVLAPSSEAEIITQPGGYSLRAEKTQIDLHLFRSLVGTAQHTDATRASAQLEHALELWSGPPLAGVSGHWLPSRVGIHIEEERLSALEEHAAATLAAGRLQEATIELTSLIRDHPLRERAVSLLMTALHRSGRRAEALRVFQATRQHLVRELGLEPDGILRATHQQILTDAPTLLPT